MDDSESETTNDGPSEAQVGAPVGGGLALLGRIVERIKDQGLLAIAFVSVLAFVALWSGISPTVVVALTILLIFSILAVELLPKILQFLTTRQETDNVWAHRKAELELQARQLQDRKLATSQNKGIKSGSSGSRMRQKR